MYAAYKKIDNYDKREIYTGELQNFGAADRSAIPEIKAKIAKLLKYMNDQRNKEERSRNNGFRYVAEFIKDRNDPKFEKARRAELYRDSRREEGTFGEWLQTIMREYEDIPLKHLESLVWGTEPEFETSAEEYISVRNRASVFTKYAYGKKVMEDGTVYEAKVTASSDVHGI
jgi:hypothetical protein